MAEWIICMQCSSYNSSCRSAATCATRYHPEAEEHKTECRHLPIHLVSILGISKWRLINSSWCVILHLTAATDGLVHSLSQTSWHAWRWECSESCCCLGFSSLIWWEMGSSCYSVVDAQWHCPSVVCPFSILDLDYTFSKVQLYWSPLHLESKVGFHWHGIDTISWLFILKVYRNAI